MAVAQSLLIISAISDEPLSQTLARAIALHFAGSLAEAEELCRQILLADPRQPDALHLLGRIAHQTKHHAHAVTLIRQAIAVRPDAAEYHNQLGHALAALHQSDEAVAAYQCAVALEPSNARLLNNLGVALRATGRYEQAVQACRRAVELSPESALTHFNLANALQDCGLLADAIPAYRTAISLQPQLADAHNNLAAALAANGQLEEVIAECQRAITLNPNLGPAYTNLALALKDSGRLDEAISVNRQAMALQPDHPIPHSNLITALQYLPDADDAAIYEEALRWNARHAIPLQHLVAPHSNARSADGRIRIGYVSPDFRRHPVAHFIAGPLTAHDPQQVEVFCYSNASREDAVTDMLRPRVAQWRRITGVSDQDAAQLIRHDEIDILVDLAGHTAGNRLLLFARKPAPVQVTYLGYPGTTGLSAIDYRLTDDFADPPGSSETFYSEQLVRLPETFLCYQLLDEPPPLSPPPAVSRGHITFGCFSSLLCKLNMPLVQLWAEILRRIPSSRMIIKNRSMRESSTQRRIVQMFTDCGVAAGRLELRPSLASWQHHMSAYNDVDIALDTYPYNGTTTTCEALCMGVPVITLAGRSHRSRVGVSILRNAGLNELIAQNEQEYVDNAARLAIDAQRLGDPRATSRQRMQESSLMNVPLFTQRLEAAYRQMWQTWCKRG